MIPDTQNGVEEETAVINKQLTSVTPFSKYLAMALFIILPFVGFWVGTHYPVELITPTQEEPLTSTASETESASDNYTVETETVTKTTPQVTETKQAVYTPPPVASPTVVSAYIKSATLSIITLDYIAIYEDDAAINKMISDGLCPASEPKKCRLEGGVYYRNTDLTEKTLALSPNVEVLTWTGSEYPMSKIKNNVNNNTPYRITLDSNNVVIKIKEVYRP